MTLIEKAILLFREQGNTGERFGITIDRIGADKFIEMLLSDEVLERKEEILEALFTPYRWSCMLTINILIVQITYGKILVKNN